MKTMTYKRIYHIYADGEKILEAYECEKGIIEVEYEMTKSGSFSGSFAPFYRANGVVFRRLKDAKAWLEA